MNLHNTLKAYNEAQPITKEQQLVIDEVNNILISSAENDLSILKNLGMDKNIVEYEKIKLEENEASNFDEIYDISTIRKMAIHYGLRFLPSDMYNGTVDPQLPSILNRFVGKHNIKIDETKKQLDYDWRGRERSNGNNKQFFILAPASSFQLEERPKDPIIFYKINDEKYAFVHKWGNDLNNSRYLSNYPLRSTGHFCLYFSLMIVLGSLIFMLATGQKECLLGLVLLIINIPILIEADFNDTNWNNKHK